MGSNPSPPINDTRDYSSMKSGPDPTFEIPVHEELTNAADSPTFGYFLQVDVPGGKVVKYQLLQFFMCINDLNYNISHFYDLCLTADYVLVHLLCSQDASEKEKNAPMSSSPKNHKSSVAGEKDKVGKPVRQLRKRATCKPVDPAENEDVEEEEEDELDPTYKSNINELEEHDDEYGLDNASKKKTAPSSKKKSMAKNEKPTQKRKRTNGDLDRCTKEPSKNFSHSTRRRKRCGN